MKKTLIYIISALLTTACVYPYTADIESSANQEVVIDANILLGSKSTVNLSYLQPLEPGQRSHSYGVPSGTVYLTDEKGKTYPASGSNGYYTLNVPENVEGKLKLTAVVEGNTYVSDWVEPVAPPVIKDVRFTADDTNVNVLLSMEDEGVGSGYAALQYDEIWKFHTDYVRCYEYDVINDSVYMLQDPADYHYWCWTKKQYLGQQLIDYTNLNGKVQDFVALKFPRSDSRNHSEYIIRLKLWNLTPEQYKYRKMLEENASIGSNLFSPEPGEIRGNIHCENNPDIPVYGYLNIARINTITKEFFSSYSTWRPQYKLVEVEEDKWLAFYKKGYLPIDEVLSESGQGSVVAWGEGRCWDCVVAGGTLKKPEFD